MRPKSRSTTYKKKTTKSTKLIRRDLEIRCRVFTKAKVEHPKAVNADSVSINFENNIVALSDGVSRSFSPDVWARRVARFAAKSSSLRLENIDWGKFISSTLRPSGSDEVWNLAEMRLLGSQCTLLKVTLGAVDEFTVSMLAETIGDCELCVFDPDLQNGLDILLWPFAGSQGFPFVPDVLSSTHPHVRGVCKEDRFFFPKTHHVLVMSDALGRFLTESITTQAHVYEVFPFLAGSCESKFEEWVELRLAEGSLENDDISIVEIRFA